MSCSGCRTKVEKALNTIESVSAEITLDPPQAIITMQNHIPTERLQEALYTAGNYMIEMSGHQGKDAPGNHADTKGNHYGIEENHRDTEPTKIV